MSGVKDDVCMEVIGLTATLLNWNNHLIHQVAACFPDLDQLRRVSTTNSECVSRPTTFRFLSNIAKLIVLVRRGFVLADQIEVIESDLGGEKLIDCLVGHWDLYEKSVKDELKDLAVKGEKLVSFAKTERAWVLHFALFLPSKFRRRDYFNSYVGFISRYSQRVLQVSEEWDAFKLEVADFLKTSNSDCNFTDSSVSDDEFFSKIDGECDSAPREVVNWGTPIGREVW